MLAMNWQSVRGLVPDAYFLSPMRSTTILSAARVSFACKWMWPEQ
jgi:hypothetical protein